MKRVLAIAAVLALLAAAPAAAESNVAPCDKAIVGPGPDNWRALSVDAGPVGILATGFRRMDQTRNGLVAKMPLLVAGHRQVTISVPDALRGRVFLYYGNLLDDQGRPSFSFAHTRGYEETRFEPCPDKPRTPWPGGLRVRGTAPVHLTVRVEGQETRQLRLGRPRVRP